jgi:predicted membrane protein
MENCNNSSSSKRIYFGLFLIVFGAFWILKRLNLIPEIWDDILVSWQMLLIAIGIFSIIGGNRTTGTVLVVIGGFFLVPEIVTIPYELRRIGWPLLIIGVGVVLLVTHRKKNEPPLMQPSKHGMDYFDDFVIFGGREVFINSQNFYGGKITTIFGGAEYDLRNSLLSPNGAIIDSVSVFGGCGFKVPPDWTVKNEVTAVFGGFSDKRGASPHHVNADPSKTLVIKGFTAFGGVEIKHY